MLFIIKFFPTFERKKIIADQLKYLLKDFQKRKKYFVQSSMVLCSLYEQTKNLVEGFHVTKFDLNVQFYIIFYSDQMKLDKHGKFFSLSFE